MQNGTCLFDDVNGRADPRPRTLRRPADTSSPLADAPSSSSALTDVSVEIGTACYAGALMLQALGLGGWIYTGLNPFSRARRQRRPGGARASASATTCSPGQPLPVVTGLPGVFEGHCPPHYPDMRAAVEAVVARKYGAGGPFDPATPGPYRENATVRCGRPPASTPRRRAASR